MLHRFHKPMQGQLGTETAADTIALREVPTTMYHARKRGVSKLTRRRLGLLAAQRRSGFRGGTFGGTRYLVSQFLCSDCNSMRALPAVVAHRLGITLDRRSKSPRLYGDRGLVRLIFGCVRRHIGRKEHARRRVLDQWSSWLCPSFPWPRSSLSCPRPRSRSRSRSRSCQRCRSISRSCSCS